jgi:hypothetical protein
MCQFNFACQFRHHLIYYTVFPYSIRMHINPGQLLKYENNGLES